MNNYGDNYSFDPNLKTMNYYELILWKYFVLIETKGHPNRNTILFYLQYNKNDYNLNIQYLGNDFSTEPDGVYMLLKND